MEALREGGKKIMSNMAILSEVKTENHLDHESTCHYH